MGVSSPQAHDWGSESGLRGGFEIEMINPPEQIAGVRGLARFTMEARQYPPAIYFLCKEGRVVYVGQSMRLPIRIGGHCLSKSFDSVFWFEADMMRLDVIERAFIRYLRSPLNKRAACSAADLKIVSAFYHDGFIEGTT